MPSGFRGDRDRPEQEHPQYSCAFADALEPVLRSVRPWTQIYLKGSFWAPRRSLPMALENFGEIAVQSSRCIEVHFPAFGAEGVEIRRLNAELKGRSIGAVKEGPLSPPVAQAHEKRNILVERVSVGAQP